MTDRKYSATATTTTLASSATASATVITVSATTGFPAVPFILVLDAETASQEVVLVTGAAGTNLTVERGYDGTAAVAHSVGAVVEHSHSAIDFRDSRTHENATAGIHGVTGSLVGTSDAQSLTNKDLSSGTNTFPATLATDAELTTHAGLGSHVPIGAISMYGGSTDPDANWLIADGRALNRTTYSALFAKFGTTFGAGDGSTTFNLPNPTGRLPIGVGGSHLLGELEGSETKTIATANLPSHTHSMAHTHSINHDHETFTTASGGAHTHTYTTSDAGSNTLRAARGSTVNETVVQNDGNGAHSHFIDVPAYSGTSGASSAATTGTTGSGTALNIMPPTIGLNFIVRVL